MKIFKVCGNMLAIVLVSIIIGSSLLTAVYYLPTDRVYRNMETSVKFYETGGDSFKWAGNIIQTRLDNFTDSIILMKTIYPTDNSVFNAAIFVPSWNFVIDNSPTKFLVNVLNTKLKNSPNEEHIYPRYWHGYLTVLKPALYLFKLSDIKLMNFFLQFFLIITTLFLFYKKLGICYAYVFAVVLIIINPVTTAMCFQFSTIFYLTLIAAIIMLKNKELLLRNQNYIYFFLIFGIATAYFDFLTYPITEFGILICLYTLLNKQKIFEDTLIKFFKTAGIYLFSWFFGYGAMWSGKWIIVYLFSDYDIISDTLGSLIYRTSSFTEEIPGVYKFTFFDVFRNNFDVFMEGPLKFILIIAILIFLVMTFVKNKKFVIQKNILMIFGFIIGIPFLWYLLASNHSYVHPFLAYRNLSVAFFGICCLLIESTEKI